MGNTKATNAAILNAVRKTMDLSYQNRIPEATAENINSIYTNLLNIVPLRNAFAEALVTQIMEQRIESTFFENPLGILKKDPMRYGMTEEEIFVNMASGYQFNQFATVNDLYAYYQSAVMAAYHKITPPIQYAVTITFDNLRNAFRSETGIRDLINAKIQSLFAGANWDEYLCMKRLIETAYANNQIFAVQIPDITDAEKARNFTTLMKSYIGQMKFPNPQFNIAGATSAANDDTIFYITTPDVDAMLDVEVLAYAFNMNKADIAVRKIIIDKFDNPAIKAVLFDMRFFNVRENYRQLSDSKNGAALTWNYFYTVSEMFSYSPFFPCIAFTTDSIGLENITITEVESYTAGTDIEIKALASGTETYKPQLLDYEVSGNSSSYTSFIPGSNILHIANDEQAAALTVTVTSRYDKNVSGTITINKG